MFELFWGEQQAVAAIVAAACIFSGERFPFYSQVGIAVRRELCYQNRFNADVAQW